MPTKILAIDDSKTMRLAIKITFAAEDAKVTAVSKGSEAVARARQMQADVILVDHKLGDGEPSGVEVVAALKAHPSTANIPVILLVPARGGVSEAEISAAGADNFIGKPFDSQDLIDKVAAALGRAVAKPAAKAPAAAAPAATRKPVGTPAATPPAGVAPVKPPAATPPVAAPPVAATPAVRKPVGATPAAATPATPPLAAKPNPTPAVAPKPVAAKPLAPAPTPARAPVATPAPTPTPVAAKPVPGPARTPVATSASPAATATPAAATVRAPASGVPAQIPIAVPIPFTAASSPTPGMLERIKAAASTNGAAAGLDPGAIRALLQLSHEVVEAIVWEVVPDLAEEIIKQKVR
jgi:CheY-like chemotaxis protein